MGVTCKKMYKKCISVCVKTEILDPSGQTIQTDTTTTKIINVQPQQAPVIPKEIKKILV
jgi:phosphoribosylformylglycinamidine (FGAM) synthase PurS component